MSTVWRRLTHMEPIVLARQVLLAKYLVLALFGGVAASAGVPSIDLTTPEGYRPLWAGLVVISGLVSFFACLIGRRAELIEWFSVLVLMSFLAAYVGAIASGAIGGNEDKQALAVVIFTVVFMPFGRWLALASRGRELVARWRRRKVSE